MGNKQGTHGFLPFEAAVKKLKSDEFDRIQACFKRSCAFNGDMMSLKRFIEDILTPAVPQNIADVLFAACGGSDRGIAFKDLVVSLVIISKGDLSEKIKFLYHIFAQNGSEINTYQLRNQLIVLEHANELPLSALEKLGSAEVLSYDDFMRWVLAVRKDLAITKWLFDYPPSISSEISVPSFHQTLAGVTHLDEKEILEVEKVYGSRLVEIRTGKLDYWRFLSLVSPPLPSSVVSGLFQAFDDNNDNQVDFKELICGISASCRGPESERHKFCFKVFDTDRDGKLGATDLRFMAEMFLEVRQINRPTGQSATGALDVDTVVSDCALDPDSQTGSGETGTVDLQRFLHWCLDNPLVKDFLSIITQVCHIVFGLPPQNKREEFDVINSWIDREVRNGYVEGQFWHLVYMEWWNSWLAWVQHEDHERSSSPITSDRYKVNGSVAFASTDVDNVVITGFTASAGGDNDGFNLITTDEDVPVADKASASDGSTTPEHERKTWSPCPPRILTAAEHHILRQHKVPTRPKMIDNSPLVAKPKTNSKSSRLISLTNDGGQLKLDPAVANNREFQLVPESVWTALTRWYKGSSPALPRKVVLDPDTKKLIIELNPPVVTVYKHQQSTSGQTGAAQGTSVGLNTFTNMGASAMAGGFNPYVVLNAANAAYSYFMNVPRRVPLYRAAFSQLTTVGEIHRFLCDSLRLNTESSRLWLITNSTSTTPEMVLLEEDGLTLRDLSVGSTKDPHILIEIRNRDLTWPEETTLLAKSKKQVETPSSVHHLEPGVTGISNLGNTCFMNSAVQCVSNTRPLTDYFLKGIHEYELNVQNALGMKGHIALEYAKLVKDLWSGKTKVIAPVQLKNTISRYAAQFNDFEQHDCQELLSFLLDGLHEDLNRVQLKPYVELKDSDGRDDQIVAAEAWENHILRNKSIVVDLFHGLLKSSVRCAECNTSSVRFDPFTFISLPLPYEHFVFIQVLLVRMNGSLPVKYGFRLGQDDRVAALKEEIAKLAGDLTSSQMIILDVFPQCPIRAFLDDKQKLKLLNSGILCAFEIPKYEIAVDGIELETVKPKALIANGYANGNGPSKSHSRASSYSSVSLKNEPIVNLDSRGDIPSMPNYTVCIHRKMEDQELYFLSHKRYAPVIFGLPMIVPCPRDDHSWTGKELYDTVHTQISRLLCPLPQNKSSSNHALDGDETLYAEYPFKLCMVTPQATQCAVCPWYRFCSGCSIEADDSVVRLAKDAWIAVDWAATALHLRYQRSLETACVEHPSVAEIMSLQSEPIDLASCLKSFTTEEQLQENDQYYCAKCKKHCRASKKLDIWKLPPFLIIHFKRFQCLRQNTWVKSNKIVNFPLIGFDPSAYLVSRQSKDTQMPTEANDVEHNGSVNHSDSIPLVNGHLVEEESGDKESSSPESDIPHCVPNDHHLTGDNSPDDLKYDISAFACHLGHIGRGHYVCYAKNPNGRWYLYNDSSCKEVRVEEIDQSNAYIAFYERRGLDYAAYIPPVDPLKATPKVVVSAADDNNPEAAKSNCILQ